MKQLEKGSKEIALPCTGSTWGVLGQGMSQSDTKAV